MAGQKVVKTFTKNKETKNTWRYGEDTPGKEFNSLYLSKEDCEELGSPLQLKVTFERGDN